MPRQLSVRRKAGFALITTVAFFVALEVVLALLGVRPVQYREDPFVGFSSYFPLFVERAGPDGVRMVTAENKLTWFNEQEFADPKPGGAFRIFCMGGSTTYGRPYNDATSFSGWLRELLPVAGPSTEWEVINAGGISYASYRVARLMEDLNRYEPDLFVIYSGHNEFLEERRYGDTSERSEFLQGVQALVGRSRTYALIRNFVQPDTPTGAGPGNRFQLPGEVDAILDRSVGPEVYTRDDPPRDQVLAHFRLNLRRMIEIARAAGAQVLLVVPASNLRHCSPFKSENRADITIADLERWRTLFESAKASFESGDFDDALQNVDQALTIDDRHAGLHFLHGQILDRLQQPDRALAAYERAREEDVCPLRGVEAIARIVRETAQEEQTPVVDFDALVRARSPQHIPGNELFIDHVHPTIEGHRLLATSILAAMQDASLAPPRRLSDAEIEQVTRRVEGRINNRDHGLALRNLAMVLGWAGKFEEADRLALQAVEMIPDDARARHLAGNAWIRRGEPDRAIEYLRRALDLDPGYAATWYSLGVVYYQSGRFAEAAEAYQHAMELDPDTPGVYHNLGLAYEQLGQSDRAVSYYEEAIRRTPRRFSTYNLLGVLYATHGNLDKAGELFRKSLEINPRQPDALTNLGRVAALHGDAPHAVEMYREALGIDPQNVAAASNLAWVLATSSDASVRDGREAVHWARMCVEQTGSRDPNLLSILAAAYAEAGDFDEAVRLQTEAIDLMDTDSPDSGGRLELYRSHRPFRDSR